MTAVDEALLARVEETLARVSVELPWRQDSGWGEDIISADGVQFGATGYPGDAAAIVACVNTSPALVAEVRRLRAQVDAVTALAERWGRQAAEPRCLEDWQVASKAQQRLMTGVVRDLRAALGGVGDGA